MTNLAFIRGATSRCPPPTLGARCRCNLGRRASSHSDASQLVNEVLTTSATVEPAPFVRVVQTTSSRRHLGDPEGRDSPVGACAATQISGRFPVGILGLSLGYPYSVYRLSASWSNVQV
jgi:hypothetical protein